MKTSTRFLSAAALAAGLLGTSAAHATQTVPFTCSTQGSVFHYVITGYAVIGSEGLAQLQYDSNRTRIEVHDARGGVVLGSYLQAPAGDQEIYPVRGSQSLQVQINREAVDSLTIWHDDGSLGRGNPQSYSCDIEYGEEE